MCAALYYTKYTIFKSFNFNLLIGTTCGPEKVYTNPHKDNLNICAWFIKDKGLHFDARLETITVHSTPNSTVKKICGGVDSCLTKSAFVIYFKWTEH